MSNVIAWALFVLGVAHIVFGLVKFKTPLLAATAAGFVGQFQAPEIRRTAFWFLMVGPLVMLAGHIAIHAVAVGDLALLKLIGIYLSIAAIIGVAAFPKSPFLALLVLSPLLVAAGYGLIVPFG
jgi:uncharacterized membrane protein HdeD (DUF308 family)